MEGVGPGTVLGGRYTVGTLLRDAAGAQRWTATEPDLGRSVGLLVLPSSDDRAASVLDAARMAAGLDIPACVRVLDIGQEGPVAWVVEESLADARSVGDLVRSGGLPGDEVRRIVGEAASALDAAAARGMHHLRISPDEVFRTTDGDIKVRGLATEAALHRAEEDAQSASRTDAVCLVSLTYAALTGLWPLRDVPSSLQPAPRLVHGVPAPSEIAAGVPRDLDALCRMTLSGQGGPTSPGDYARQIAPWSSRQIVGRPTLLNDDPTPTGGAAATPAESVDGPESGTERTQTVSAREEAPVATPAGRSQTAPTTALDTAATVGAVAGGAAASTATSGPSAGSAGGTSTAVAEDVDADPTAATSRTEVIPTTQASSSRIAMGERVQAIRSKLPPLDGDAPAPLVPAEPLTKDESKVALGIVAAFVLASLLVGIYGVSRIGSNTNFDLSVGSRSSSSASASAPAPAPSGPKPLAILSADGFDPKGDNKENGQAAPKVFDGDPNTAWTSEGYRTPTLGGLKPGVGVIVDLGPNVSPSHVDLTLGAPADVEVYVSADRSIDNATKVAEAGGANGVASFDLPTDQTAGKQYLIVWFTSLSQVDGFYRAVLGEVAVQG